MSPLEIKTSNLEGTEWIKLGVLEPGEPSSSISNNPPEGEREIYFFHCESNNCSSVVQRAIKTKEELDGTERTLTSTEYEEIARLRVGDKPFDLDINTDNGIETTIRFIHKER